MSIRKLTILALVLIPAGVATAEPSPTGDCRAVGRAFGVQAGTFHTRTDCADHLGAYRVLALDSRTGEMPRSLVPSAGATTLSFVLPARREGEELLISGAGAPPLLTIASPNGAQLTTPAQPGITTRAGATMIAAIDPGGRSLRILLRHPAGGTWILSLQPGSAPVTGVVGAIDHAPPRRRQPRGESAAVAAAETPLDVPVWG